MAGELTRRELIRSSAAVLTVAGATVAQNSQPTANASGPLPMAPLGKTGVKVTRLGMGASFPDYGPRILNRAFQMGIRYFDNSDYYLGGKAEAVLGDWVGKTGRRNDVFIVTKSHSYTPEKFYKRAVQALEELKVDTVDLFFVHRIDDPEIPLDRKGEWRKLKDRLLREKKIRFMGFSTHAEMPVRSACLRNAVKGGWVDALMVACDPGLIRAYPEFDKALDTCANAGVGLMCMKTTQGLGKGAKQPAAAVEAFKALGLSPHQAMQAGMWSDGRFAGVCSEMSNFKIMEENTAGLRAFRKPFDADQRKVLEGGMKRLSRATCNGCDGACRVAAGAETDFCSIARYLSYYEQDGKRARARELYAELTEQARRREGCDLAAASRACGARLDFQSILERAERLLA